MTRTKGNLKAVVAALALTAGMLGFAELEAQAPAECPLHDQHQREADAAAPAAAAPAAHDAHDAHGAHDADTVLDQVDARGDQVMGFSHTGATHHFLLTGTGGAIEVSVNDAGDANTRRQVRTHLQKVAGDFAVGDFRMPQAIHGRAPTGVEAMRAKGEAIAYRYRETEAGGRVELVATDDEGRAAIHAFLRFQILEHRTGDPLEPPQP